MNITARVIRKDGYVQIRVDGKPVLEHRFFVEQSIGRRLTTNETVHHVNHNRADNRLDNLVVLRNSDHLKHHWTHHRERILFLQKQHHVDGKCQECRKSFHGISTKRFCSRRCGNRHKSRRHYRQHLVESRQRNLASYYKHRDERMAYHRKYYRAHAVHLITYARAYYKDHRAQYAANAKKKKLRAQRAPS